MKQRNEIYVRHLTTRKQEAGETRDQDMQALRRLHKDCNFQGVTAQQNRDDGTREAFTHGLQSVWIRQCLLENVTLHLQTALDQVRNIDVAQKPSESSGPPVFSINAATVGT